MENYLVASWNGAYDSGNNIVMLFKVDGKQAKAAIKNKTFFLETNAPINYDYHSGTVKSFTNKDKAKKHFKKIEKC